METSHHVHEVIAILDAGSQYGKVIDRRLREINVETRIFPLTTPASELCEYSLKGIIISGGPQSVYEPGAKLADMELFEMGLPVLGICYGMQLMCFQAGRQVGKKTSREDGQFVIKIDQSSALYQGMEEQQQVLLTHGDTVFDVPPNWRITGKSGNLIASIEHSEKPLYGVQFHPEVNLTLNGTQVFRNFAYNICHCHGIYSMQDRKEIAIQYIRSKVGEGRSVLVLVSGGVDSSVCAALCTAALGGDRVHALHISNGFMRKDESKTVEEELRKLNLRLKVVDAAEDFYSAKTTIKINKRQKDKSSGGDNQISTSSSHNIQDSYETDRLDCVLNPEEKRKIIGDTFMRIAQREVAKLGLDPEATYFAQGTLRPDLIESASETVSSSADVIKTHHNDTELVRDLRKRGHVIEPLSEYHKDEVRELGRSLGLAEHLVARQPFPGPGLSIRIICAPESISKGPNDPHTVDVPHSNPNVGHLDASFFETNQKLEYLLLKYSPDDKSAAVPEELYELREEEQDIFRKLLKTSHISAQLLPMKTVGVQGDGRSYKYLCVLSCSDVNSNNVNEKANPDTQIFCPNWEELFGLAKFLPKIYHNINRVVYAFGPRITKVHTELTPTILSPDVIHLLQEADFVVNSVLIEHHQISKVSQAPIILFPCGFEKGPNFRSIAIRTLITNDFMTGTPAVPGRDIDEHVLLKAVEECSKIPGISRIVYDLTSKPPATTEWE